MVHENLPQPPISALLQVRLGLERGLTEESLLRGTRLRMSDVEDPNAEVTPRQELTLVTNLVEGLGDGDGLGLIAGQRYHLTSYGLWGFMLISCPTPRQAIELALRYLDLTFALCAITAEQHEDSLVFSLAAEHLPRGVRRYLVERDAAALRTIQREAFPEMLPLQSVGFAFPEPREDLGEATFGTRPSYGQESSTIAYSVGLLDGPMPQANEHTAALMQAQCVALLQRRRARAGLSGRVRDLLVARLSEPPDADSVAGELHLSSRTLQRRLSEEGVTLRGLLDEVREQLAEELLVTGGLPVSDVARRLGYVEVSSFSQAFRRWKGVGPREFRSLAHA